MTLSRPIWQLKQAAKRLSRETGKPLHAALDEVAAGEGFSRWSLLVSRALADPVPRVLAALDPGDMMLIGARPGHGKTVLGVGLAASAGQIGREGIFFTLDYTREEVAARLADLGHSADAVEVDASDEISADHVIARLKRSARPPLAVIDYLQLLDQRRSTPPVGDQVAALSAFARASGAMIVLISQIDRAFEADGRALPGRSDLRLPNPVNLSLFGKACFLQDGRLRFEAA